MTGRKPREGKRAEVTSVEKVQGHIVEIVSDSGEGAQTAGQCFGAISARMGNGVWTVEIIPSDIQPPPRSVEGVSGIRIRIGQEEVTNAGGAADMVVAFNEVALYGRLELDAYHEGTLVLIESKWGSHSTSDVRESYAKALSDFMDRGFRVVEIPMQEEMNRAVPEAMQGKNMWVLGMLCALYQRDMEIAAEQVRRIFRQKPESIVKTNLKLLTAGFEWASANLAFRFELASGLTSRDMVVMNGNEALGLGIMAAGMEVCSMYPITPATSVTHHLAACFHKAGGVIHQAEDEIAAIGFAIGASYAGKSAVTITSGPGLALMTEFIGLAVMGEVPVVIIDVQRGGPSTGLPTKVEQSDLLAALHGQPGDTPKIVLAPSSIEECFHFVLMARKLAEAYRSPVILLSDAALGTGVQPFKRPELQGEWLANTLDFSDWPDGAAPYGWNEKTGLSARPIPGQKGGAYTLTGLAHNRDGEVTYNAIVNQEATRMRSRKLATLVQTLPPPEIFGDKEGELLLVGWGSTRGAIEEAVSLSRSNGLSVSSLHLRFLSPLEPGLKGIFSKFRKVMTVEINYSDDAASWPGETDNRRYAQLAWILRAHTLVDVDCFSNVFGQPMRPDKIVNCIRETLKSNKQ